MKKGETKEIIRWGDLAKLKDKMSFFMAILSRGGLNITVEKRQKRVFIWWMAFSVTNRLMILDNFKIFKFSYKTEKQAKQNFNLFIKALPKAKKQWTEFNLMSDNNELLHGDTIHYTDTTKLAGYIQIRQN